jgi:hypothetical protein
MVSSPIQKVFNCSTAAAARSLMSQSLPEPLMTGSSTEWCLFCYKFIDEFEIKRIM